VRARADSLARAGSLQESLTDAYNDDLREMLESGQIHDEDVKQLLKELRDAQRVPDGASVPPTLNSMQQLSGASPEAVLGAACKAAFQLARTASARL